MSTTTCTCCRGRRCVRVRSLNEIGLDTALLRLQDKLSRERSPGRQLQLQLQPVASEPASPLRPWEMSRRQFDTAGQPGVESGAGRGAHRFRGLSRSVLRREVHFLLRYPGAPADGYRVRVPERRADLYNQPHRAFVEAALADGLSVPAGVLSEYPELRTGRPLATPPRLDFSPRS
jgi:hypothetical protein